MQRLNLSALLELARGGYAKNGYAAPVVTVQAKNTSGGALARGDVVILDVTGSTVDLLACKTTTSGNDVKVLGMIYDTSVADTAIGRVQIFGPTRYLKVDGTTDIAVGDMLGTFTTAKIAQKSTTGGRFAMALEAYTTNDSNGVIDAFLMNLGFQAYSTE